MAVRDKTLLKLINSDVNKTLGNHSVKIQDNGDRWYYYFKTPVVKHINPSGMWEFIIDISYGSITTRQTVNKYFKLFDISEESPNVKVIR